MSGNAITLFGKITIMIMIIIINYIFIYSGTSSQHSWEVAHRAFEMVQAAPKRIGSEEE